MAKLFPGDATSAYPEDRSLLEREMDKILSPRTQNVAKVRRYLSTFVGPKTVRTRSPPSWARRLFEQGVGNYGPPPLGRFAAGPFDDDLLEVVVLPQHRPQRERRLAEEPALVLTRQETTAHRAPSRAAP